MQFSKHLHCIFNQDLSYNLSFVGVSKTTNCNPNKQRRRGHSSDLSLPDSGFQALNAHFYTKKEIYSCSRFTKLTRRPKHLRICCIQRFWFFFCFFLKSLVTFSPWFSKDVAVGLCLLDLYRQTIFSNTFGVNGEII